MERRAFVRKGLQGSAYLAFGGTGLLSACTRLERAVAQQIGEPLRFGPTVSPDGLVLRAREVVSGSGRSVSRLWTFGDGPIGPTIEAARGDPVRILLHNELPEPTIVHWHGFRPPESADGHPRLAVRPGSSYGYEFRLDEPAGLYWYHPHPAGRTAAQTYLGLAGLFIVRDAEERRLQLPSGEREIALLLQDRRLDGQGRVSYSPRMHDAMEGYLGDVVHANGVANAHLEVGRGLYRFRVLSATNARILRVAFSDGRPFTLIGSDAGFLPRPAEVRSADVSTAERLDILVDFSDLPAGSQISLRSLPFTSSSGMGMRGMRMGMGGMGGGTPQGAEMDLVKIRVVDRELPTLRTPSSLPAFEPIRQSWVRRERQFRLQSGMMSHGINGHAFAVERVDERVPFGTTEAWTFVNESPFPHSVHLHATHFQLLSRTGGRGAVMPWESGWKDTVLILPEERVDLIARFDRHPGLYLIHCHNLEHEDMGMMLNFLIE